jgi:hypothetical protein
MNATPTLLRRTLVSCVTTALLMALAGDSAAQEARPAVRLPRVEVGGGVGWVGQSDVGTRDATFTANQPGAEPDPVALFNVNGRTRSGVVGSGSIGINLTNAWGIEGVFHYSRPKLSADISADVEGAPNLTLVASSFTQTVVEGNVLYHFNRARIDNEHTVPFVLIGVGSLRHKNSDEGIDEVGTLYQAGVGFKWTGRIDARRRARGLGLRLDIRYVLRDGGVDFSDDARRSFVAATAATSFAF